MLLFQYLIFLFLQVLALNHLSYLICYFFELFEFLIIYYLKFLKPYLVKIHHDEELNGFIYEMQTHGSQGLVKARYLDPLVKNINSILKNNGIEKNYVISYEKVKIGNQNNLFQASSEEKPQAIILPTATLVNVKDNTEKILKQCDKIKICLQISFKY